jgi:hypothetical protein
MRSRLTEPRFGVVAAAVLLAVAVLVAAGFVGRREKHRWVDSQLRGMARVERLVGPLDQRSLVGFRVLPQFDCLVYRRGPELLALELCVDRTGRLLEAIDRRGGARRYYDLESDPGAASIRVDRAEVDRLLQKMIAS